MSENLPVSTVGLPVVSGPPSPSEWTKSRDTCVISGCERKPNAKNLCMRHYDFVRRGGGSFIQSTVVERFWSLVDKSDPHGCWIWRGPRNVSWAGYGKYNFNGQSVLAHRFAYALINGPIPEGKVLDHLCRVEACVNPAHLEATTDAINISRSNSVSAENRRKSHCKHGHELTPENIYTPPKRPNGRYCLTCRNDRNAARSRSSV